MRHHNTRQLWRILGFGPNGEYIVGWPEGKEKPDLIKLSPQDRDWKYVSQLEGTV